MKEATSLILSIGTQLSTLFSQRYQHFYNLGIVEWRVMTVLSQKPNVRLKDICNVLIADKAGISRALVKLHEKRLVSVEEDQWHKSSKQWQLTPGGLALHDVILEETNQLSCNVMDGISTEHVQILHNTLKQVNKNIQKHSHPIKTTKST